MTDPAADPATDATLLAAARRQPERWARGAGGTTVGEGAIDLASGGSFAVVTEVDLDGTLPLRLVRAYDSDPSRPAGVFGPGWCSTFDVRLLVDAGGAALVLPDGALVLFPATVTAATDTAATDTSATLSAGSTTGADTREATHSTSGPLMWLAGTGRGGFRVFDPATEWTWHFPGPQTDDERTSATGSGVSRGSRTKDSPHVLPVEALTDPWGNRIRWSRYDTTHLLEHSSGTSLAVVVAGPDPAQPDPAQPDPAQPVVNGRPVAQLVVVDPDFSNPPPVRATVPTSPPAAPRRWTDGDVLVVHTRASDGAEIDHRIAPSGAGTLTTTSVDGRVARVVGFDASGRERRRSTPAGVQVTDVNHRGQPVRTVAGGRELVLTRSDSGAVVRAVTDEGTWVVESVAPSRPVAVTGPDGARRTATWDRRGLPVTLTLGSRPHTFETGPTGALERIGFPGGGTTQVENTPAGLVRTLVDPDGHVVTIRRDILGSPVAVAVEGAGTWQPEADGPPAPALAPAPAPAPDVDDAVQVSLTAAGRAESLTVGGLRATLRRHPDGSVAGATCGRAVSGQVAGGSGAAGVDDGYDDDGDAFLSLPGLDLPPTSTPASSSPEALDGFHPDRLVCDPDSCVGVALADPAGQVALLDPPGTPDAGEQVRVLHPDGRSGTVATPTRHVTGSAGVPGDPVAESGGPFEALRAVPFLRGRPVAWMTVRDWIREVDALVARPGGAVSAALMTLITSDGPERR
ncbi:DUF6531 domain-containing protein [Dietzia sp. NCCP-2495]|uniref:DUF6531 domain-containing protein n=1 Tax=Dietzia sp. NCCP-2495 TaxID=2934675 RepID=UPI002231E9A8|nr:DUF6531 domain-containing protein [Dietzia sp. NCCP-2495]